MKKIKIIRIITLSIVLTVSFFIIASFSFAEDDEREEREERGDDYRSEEIQQAQPNLEIVPPSQLKPQLPIANKTADLSPVTSTQSNINRLVTLKDSDQDGIPDNNDKHPGLDDFSFSLIDNNNNGIADDLEILVR